MEDDEADVQCPDVDITGAVIKEGYLQKQVR